METLDPALAHHGVKGMKWGVRRRGQAAVETASSSGHASPSAHVSEDHKAAVVAKTKHPSHLSNKEMQDLITRMNLEQQYTRLLTTPPPAIPRAPLTRKKKALNFVTNLLADIEPGIRH